MTSSLSLLQEDCPFTEKAACEQCPALELQKQGQNHLAQAERASLAEALARQVKTSPSLCRHLSIRSDSLLYAAFDWKERIHLYKTVESTNTIAREVLATAIERTPLHHHDGSLTKHGCSVQGSIFLAEQQTGGKGRLGRSFFSPQATGLYMSLIVVPPDGVTNPALLTATTAVAVCKALEQVYKIEPAIKWVNDIFYQGKKIGGILAEGVMDATTGTIPGAVIGIGVNIMPPAEGFPLEIESIAGAVFPDATEERRLSKQELVVAIVAQLLQLLEAAWRQDSRLHATGDCMKEYRKRCLIRPGHKIVVVPAGGSVQESYSATCLGIDHLACLQIQREDGSQTLLDSGEVSLHSQTFANQ